MTHVLDSTINWPHSVDPTTDFQAACGRVVDFTAIIGGANGAIERIHELRIIGTMIRIASRRMTQS